MIPRSSPTPCSRRRLWTVPLTSHSGHFAPGFFNAFNGSNQYNYAAKHDPMVFFTDTNGGDDATPDNPLSSNYAPLQQLFIDLADSRVADYNWITPDQYNDMHTALTGGGYKGLTGDSANIKQGDDFLRQVIPAIMASDAYKNHGVIVIWFDESEQDTATANPDDFNHTIAEIIISPRAHENVGGRPYAQARSITRILQICARCRSSSASGRFSAMLPTQTTCRTCSSRVPFRISRSGASARSNWISHVPLHNG